MKPEIPKAQVGKDPSVDDNAGVKNSNRLSTRRTFLRSAGLGTAGLGLIQIGCSVPRGIVDGDEKVIQGFEEELEYSERQPWRPISDRKIRVGIVGYGVCRFGAAFGFQNHPNVEIVAVSDLFPDRCNELARVCGTSKTYPSLEELVKDSEVEAVFVATDAPNHAKHCLEVLKHGKHVAVAVPAVFGSLEEADQLMEAVKTSGMKYMMFETSVFRSNLYAMRQLYQAGDLGEIVYSEGEYYHYMPEPIDSYKGWRIGLPPQYYPTHSNAYHIGVTGGTFTEVSCMGMKSVIKDFQVSTNVYKNEFASEIAMFRTSEGAMSRMAVSWDTPGDHGERGRVRGQKGSFYEKYEGLSTDLPNLVRPGLPEGVPAGGHGGSHGLLTDEFISAILLDRNPLVDIGTALNMSVSGIIAHQSAIRDGELMKIPQYTL
jgi:predicted dehydrogenase